MSGRSFSHLALSGQHCRPDAELLELEQEWLAIDAAYPRLGQRYTATVARISPAANFSREMEIAAALAEAGWTAADDAEFERLEARLNEIETCILEQPAQGPAGLAVKLRTYARFAVQDDAERRRVADVPFEDLDWEHKFAVATLRELERMAEAPQPFSRGS